MLEAWDITWFPASSVPELSLRGNKPFIFFATFCLKNIQSGAIFKKGCVRVGRNGRIALCGFF